MFWIEDGDPRVLGVTDARGTRILSKKLEYPRLIACANGRVVASTYYDKLVRCDTAACDALLDVRAGTADLDHAGHILYSSTDLGKGGKAEPRTYVIGPTAKHPARVVHVAGWIIGLYAGPDDEPVLLVRVPAGVAKVHP